MRTKRNRADVKKNDIKKKIKGRAKEKERFRERKILNTERERINENQSTVFRSSFILIRPAEKSLASFPPKANRFEEAHTRRKTRQGLSPCDSFKLFRSAEPRFFSAKSCLPKTLFIQFYKLKKKFFIH